MTTIDHGLWNAYTPATTPAGAPPNALFARRASDGVDWYDYVNDGSNFTPAYVKIAALYRDASGQYIVGPAVYDPTAMFPQGCIVHEVTDYTGSDPQADLGNKAFDPATGVFTDPIIPAAEPGSVAARLAALEARLGGE
jgi:hypothetical protein